MGGGQTTVSSEYFNRPDANTAAFDQWIRTQNFQTPRSGEALGNTANSIQALGPGIQDLFSRISGLAPQSEAQLAAMGRQSQLAQNDVLANVMASLGRTGASANQAAQGATRSALESQLAMGQLGQQVLGQQAGFMGQGAQGLQSMPGFYSQTLPLELQMLGFQNQPTMNRMQTAGGVLSGAYTHEPTVQKEPSLWELLAGMGSSALGSYLGNMWNK
jgi:hypothetical protein